MVTFQARSFIGIISYLGFFKGLVTLISCFLLIVDFLGNIAFELYQLAMWKVLKIFLCSLWACRGFRLCNRLMLIPSRLSRVYVPCWHELWIPFSCSSRVMNPVDFPCSPRVMDPVGLTNLWTILIINLWDYILARCFVQLVNLQFCSPVRCLYHTDPLQDVYTLLTCCLVLA